MTFYDAGYTYLPISAAIFITCLILTNGHTPHSHGYQNGEKPTGLHDPKLSQDAEHIKEHYENVANFNESDMTPEEMEFHYFKLHDYDNNTKLDGLEILKALTHLMPYDPEDDEAKLNLKDFEGKSAQEVLQMKRDKELKYYTDIVDTVMEEDDIDRDGYLTYLEYVLARKREEIRQAREEKEEKHDEH